MLCEEIENRLPAYEEDLLSPEEEKMMKDHFASCPRCSRALADLKKMKEIVQDLDEVEPPPFFEQRIMSRVREEAGQKQGFFQKFFYPFHIKIPIQVLATIVVATLAFHVYRTGEPDMKPTAPPSTPLTKLEKSQITAESPPSPVTPSVILPAKKSPAQDLHETSQRGYAVPPVKNGVEAGRTADSRAQIREEGPSAVKPAAPVTAARGKEVPAVRMETLDKSYEALPPEQKQKDKMADKGDSAVKSRQMTAAAVQKRWAIDLTIQVRDISVAVGEMEERLGQVRARIMERQHREGREFLKAEIAAPDVAAFIHQLEGIGRVHLEKPLSTVSEGNMIVNITIVNHP